MADAEANPGQAATRVFISYSRVDGAFADSLRTALIARGYDAWIDREDVAGADAPEHARHCGQTNVGQSAANALDDLVQGRTVVCTPMSTDRYGRTVALCTVGNADLARVMVSQGWARDWPRYSQRLRRS